MMFRLLFIILLMYSQLSEAQWYWQNPLPQGNDLRGLYFIDQNTGWTVGDYGEIVKTTNAGTNWVCQSSGTTEYLFSVHFSDLNNGFAVGLNGTILKTTNGGTKWTQQSSGTTIGLYSVYLINNNIAYIAGAGGLIIKTTNGGTNWITQTSGTANLLYSIWFADGNNGWSVASGGTILHTTNGGTTWVNQTSGTTNQLWGVYFTDANTGTAVGILGTILRTTNGGTNWITQTSGTTNYLYGAYFTDANTGTVVGSAGTILRTTNGGTNWVNQTSGTTQTFNGVFFLDANNGCAVGNQGTIRSTTNGGVTWFSETSGTTNNLFGVCFTDYSSGTITGAGGIILRRDPLIPLPVELSSFTSTSQGRSVVLNWSTKTEKNSDRFDVERSTSASGWSTVASVKASVLSNSPKNYTYTDTKLQSGKYQYRIKMVDNDGSFAYSDVTETEVALPNNFAVSQNYPNPFNPTTKIDYQVPVDSKILIDVYNIAGQKVSEIVNQDQSAGYYTVDFVASKLSSGVYIYRILAIEKAIGNNFSSIKKMILLK